MNALFEQNQIFGSLSHQNFIKVREFFGVYFRIDLFIDFLWTIVPKWMVAGPGDTHYFPPFPRPSLFMSTYIEICHNLAPFCFPFGALWLNVGYL